MKLKRKFEYALKHNSFMMKSFVFLGSIFFRIIGLFVRVEDDLILFSSFSGKRFNDSPKAIYEYLRSLPEGKRFRYIWAFEEPERFPEVTCEKVKIDTWRYFIATLRAGYWVCSVNIERGLKYKRKGQFYLNTWHGPAINLMGNAVEGRSDFNWDHIDCFCISGKYEAPIIMRDFKVRTEALLMSGLPRNDALYHVTEDGKNAAKKKLGIPEDKKVILYAPTWREYSSHGDSLKPPVHMERWTERLGEKYVILVRAHVNTHRLLGLQFNDQVRSESGWPEVNDLLIAADYLVSDYSSIIMDYSILGRPIICFGYDYDRYVADRGGFYFDLNREIPSGVCRREDEVLDYILDTDYRKACEDARAFRDRHIEAGGNATKICADLLLGKEG